MFSMIICTLGWDYNVMHPSFVGIYTIWRQLRSMGIGRRTWNWVSLNVADTKGSSVVMMHMFSLTGVWTRS
jgi:hypothetical protein